MQTRIPVSQLNLAVRTCFVFTACFLTAAPAVATTDAEEIELCLTEMRANQGASNIREVEAVEHEDREYARGIADFPGIEGLYFRCRVSDGAVTTVEYLVKDPDYVDKKTWTTERPKPGNQEVFKIDEGENSSPPPVPTSPKFVPAKE